MYQEAFSTKWKRPKSDFKNYVKTYETAVADFVKGNTVIAKVEAGNFSMADYHKLLKAIFHQVFFSSASFAMAGAMSSNSSIVVRDYLLHHAEEEASHWQWILEDLQSTGFKGTDPREEHPLAAAQAYLSYGIYLSVFKPVGRLAMAQVLEGISGKFGGHYGGTLIQLLKLKKENAKFFLVHGELDQGHSADIAGLLEKENLSPEDWSEMEHVARTTSYLYKQIYNSSVG